MKFVFEKNEVFEKKYKITTYPGNYTKIEMIKDWKKPGFELIKRDSSSVQMQSDKEDLIEQAKRRAKRNFLDLALCNNFEYFFTITCDSEKVDRFSIEATQELLKKVFKKTKRKYPQFKYIVCTEVHPKKKGYHFHGLCSGLSLENGALFINKNGFLNCEIWTQDIGFANSLLPLYQEDENSYLKTCLYCAKYITKCTEKLTYYYFRSRDLEKPVVTFCDEELIKNYFITNNAPSYSNSFCDIYDIYFNKLNQHEQYEFYDFVTQLK